MRAQVLLNTNGTMSLIHPGSIPLLNSVVPPSRHAASSMLAQVGLRRGRPAERDERRRDHVLARPQTPRDVVGRLAVPVVAAREVGDDVGVDRQRGVDVARGDDAGRGEPAQVTGVAPLLVLAVHDEPGELEPGVLDHRPQRADPHLARAPQDHSHVVPLENVVLRDRKYINGDDH